MVYFLEHYGDFFLIFSIKSYKLNYQDICIWENQILKLDLVVFMLTPVCVFVIFGMLRRVLLWMLMGFVSWAVILLMLNQELSWTHRRRCSLLDAVGRIRKPSNTAALQTCLPSAWKTLYLGKCMASSWICLHQKKKKKSVLISIAGPHHLSYTPIFCRSKVITYICKPVVK